MIFSEVTLSYPYIDYKIEVSHFTARKSTAIEWLILEAVRKCSEMPSYESIPVSVLFSQIFTVSDADQMIRPCLFALQDIGAIDIYNIYDDTELSSVTMADLKLTETGKEMQMKGLLPGVTSEDTFSAGYDISAGKLVGESRILSGNATGIKVLEIDDAGQIDFPADMIRSFIAEQQSRKKISMNWLAPTTQIKEINPLESVVRWKNISKKVELKEGMKWSVCGTDDESLNELTLMNTEFPVYDKSGGHEEVFFSNPDKELKHISLITGADSVIDEYSAEDDIFIVDEKYFYDSAISGGKKKDSPRVCIVFGSEKFLLEENKKQVVLHIPEAPEKYRYSYLSSRHEVKSGIITINAGNTSKKAAVMYSLNERTCDFSSEILRITEEYYKENNDIILILYRIGMEDDFFEYAGRLISAADTIPEKSRIIEKINMKSYDYYNRRLLTPSRTEKILIDEEYIRRNTDNISNVCRMLDEYAAIPMFLRNDELMHRVLGIILGQNGYISSPEDAGKLFGRISDIKKSHLAWIKKNMLYRNIYSDRIICSILENFSEESIYEMEEYTCVGQTIKNMKAVCGNINRMLPEIDIYGSLSNEKCKEVLLGHRENISSIYEELRKWQDEEENFESRIALFDDILSPDMSFTVTRNSVHALIGAISLFFDDSFMKYNNIYIVDTCTLMNEPELISWFDDGKSMLIIPVVVLDELDGLKKSEDEEKAFRAREAIRMIGNYKLFEWLNISEKSYPELLPDDIDKTRNDSRILSVAIRYIIKSPVLLTDDDNFGNIADSQKIANMSSSSYQRMKEHEKSDAKADKNNKKKKGKKKR